MALVRVKPTQADVAIADDIAARASRRSARVTVVGQRPFLGELQGVALAAGRYRILVDLVAHSITHTIGSNVRVTMGSQRLYGAPQ